MSMMRLAGLPPHRRPRLSSNVRPRRKPILQFVAQPNSPLLVVRCASAVPLRLGRIGGALVPRRSRGLPAEGQSCRKTMEPSSVLAARLRLVLRVSAATTANERYALVSARAAGPAVAHIRQLTKSALALPVNPRPNPSLEPRRYGKPRRPRSAHGYHAPHGRRVLPQRPSQLER